MMAAGACSLYKPRPKKAGSKASRPLSGQTKIQPRLKINSNLSTTNDHARFVFQWSCSVVRLTSLSAEHLLKNNNSQGPLQSKRSYAKSTIYKVFCSIRTKCGVHIVPWDTIGNLRRRNPAGNHPKGNTTTGLRCRAPDRVRTPLL